MDGFNDLTGGLIGPAALLSVKAVSVPKAPAPVFTAQPASQVLYQESGAMRITGAQASPATAFQWQKRNADNTWSDVAGRTAQSLNMSSATLAEGSYRLRAVNGNSDPVYSNTVNVVSVYLLIQNDASPANGSAAGTTKVNNQQYAHNAPSGTRYFSAFYRRFSDDSTFTPDGTNTARAVAQWVSSNVSVLPQTPVSAAGQLTCVTRAGQATLTATAGAVSSELSATIQ